MLHGVIVSHGVCIDVPVFFGEMFIIHAEHYMLVKTCKMFFIGLLW